MKKVRPSLQPSTAESSSFSSWRVVDNNLKKWLVSKEKKICQAPVLLLLVLGKWWRKLRKTEDRVRVLQERLCKLVETEEGARSTKSDRCAPSSTEKKPR
ncbi:hypothetical protein OIU76_025033 [Salix suchowensis]|nr:hypothetical protein OIU76_025033 [Salix suchowensis]